MKLFKLILMIGILVGGQNYTYGGQKRWVPTRKPKNTQTTQQQAQQQQETAQRRAEYERAMQTTQTKQPSTTRTGTKSRWSRKVKGQQTIKSGMQTQQPREIIEEEEITLPMPSRPTIIEETTLSLPSMSLEREVQYRLGGDLRSFYSNDRLDWDAVESTIDTFIDTAKKEGKSLQIADMINNALNNNQKSGLTEVQFLYLKDGFNQMINERSNTSELLQPLLRPEERTTPSPLLESIEKERPGGLYKTVRPAQSQTTPLLGTRLTEQEEKERGWAEMAKIGEK